jgi:hypothetical protein
MAEQAGQARPDVLQLWRQWLTDSERQFNALSMDAMGSDAFAQAVGSFMQSYTAVQQVMSEGMQRYLTFMNMPSRSDVVGLADTLRSIENRLARIEETLTIAAEAVESNGRYPAPTSEPPRTRRPEGMPFPERPAWAPVPEELRSVNGGG